MSNEHNKLLDQAIGFHSKGEISKAEKCYTDVLKQDAENATALHYLGVVRHQQGRNLESEGLINQALMIKPDDLMAMSNLGTTYFALLKHHDAEVLFSKVLKAQPNNFQVLNNRGNAYQSSGQFLKAIEDYRNVLKLNPQSFEAARNLGRCFQETGRNAAAEKALMICVTLAPRYLQGYVSLANFYRDTRQLKYAKMHYENALALSPNIPDIQCDYAIVLRDLGELARAKTHFETSVSLNPQLGRAWRGLAGLKTFETLPELASMQTALKDTEDANAKMHLHFALGKAHEDMGDYDQAFPHFKSANSIQASSSAYRVENDLAFFEKLKSQFNESFISEKSGSGSDSRRPIFVLGMPRSGTSLVEQILASHSKVFGAGELSALAAETNRELPPSDDLDYTASLKAARPDAFQAIGVAYLKRLGALMESGADHVVDKMPMNFMHIGIIALALPHAKIIHCRRDSLDNCLSIYKNHLPAQGHGYASKLSTLGQYYKGYQDLMVHWMDLFGNKIHEIDYEDIVQSPESEIRALLQACELDFESGCLSPHETKRVVSTLSAAQVRRPIYRQSVGSWKNYESHLKPLLGVMPPSPSEAL